MIYKKGKMRLQKAAVVGGLVVMVVLFGFAWQAREALSADMGRDKNPHQDEIQSFQERCRVCHSSDPLELNRQVFETIRFERCRDQCLACHRVPQSCLLVSTEKATKILKSQLQYLGLPLVSGSIHCGSCHFFHDQGKEAKGNHKLNSLYPNFWYRIQQIEPHRANVFCQLCHEGEPQASTPDRKADLKIKFKGDRVAVCIQCHDGKKARSDNHPVRVSPTKEKGVKVPEETFPLTDGKVTCLTCHLMPCQGGKIEQNLLRGGPYEKRVDICLTCHMKERYQAVNPHIQVDEQGKIMKNKCLYCHII